MNARYDFIHMMNELWKERTTIKLTCQANQHMFVFLYVIPTTVLPQLPKRHI